MKHTTCFWNNVTLCVDSLLDTKENIMKMYITQLFCNSIRMPNTVFIIYLLQDYIDFFSFFVCAGLFKSKLGF